MKRWRSNVSEKISIPTALFKEVNFKIKRIQRAVHQL
jgi:hypothetical protein